MPEDIKEGASFLGFFPRDWAIIITCIFIIFTLIITRPFDENLTDTEKNLGTEWNESIARLGISPVFPPQEDFYVGDIIAVISGSSRQPLLGRAVRIAHIDLREDIEKEAVGRPVFADTNELKAADEYRHQEDTERVLALADKRIVLTIAAFPGVSITHVLHAGSSSVVSRLGFGAARDESAVEELRIPVAETYGVTASRGGGRLSQWCADRSHALFCTDAFARRVLAYTVDPEILRASRNGVFTTRIEIELVTRVFMTRTIEQRRLQRLARGVSVGEPDQAYPRSEPSTDDKTATPESRARDTISAVQHDTGGLARSGTFTAEVSNGNTGEIRLQQTFQRPVVFGFRSWNIQLEPEIAK